MNVQMQQLQSTILQQQQQIMNLEQQIKILQQTVISVSYGVYDIQDYLYLNNQKLHFHTPLHQLHPLPFISNPQSQRSIQNILQSASQLEADKISDFLHKGFESQAQKIHIRKQKQIKILLKRKLLEGSIYFSKQFLLFVSFVLSIFLLLLQFIKTPKAILKKILSQELYIEWFPMIFNGKGNLEQVQEQLLKIEQRQEKIGLARSIAIGIFGGILVYFNIQ